MKIYKDETGRIIIDGEGHTTVNGTITMNESIKEAVLITNFYIEPAKGEPGYRFEGIDNIEITKRYIPEPPPTPKPENWKL